VPCIVAASLSSSDQGQESAEVHGGPKDREDLPGPVVGVVNPIGDARHSKGDAKQRPEARKRTKVGVSPLHHGANVDTISIWRGRPKPSTCIKVGRSGRRSPRPEGGFRDIGWRLRAGRYRSG
jgi:hypothetical protein